MVVRLCAACAVHVRDLAIASQRVRALSVRTTPSFSFCQVDMYVKPSLEVSCFASCLLLTGPSTSV